MTQMRVCVLALARLIARSPAVPVHTEFGVTPENQDTRGMLFKRSQTLRAHWSNAWLPVGGGAWMRAGTPACCALTDHLRAPRARSDRACTARPRRSLGTSGNARSGKSGTPPP